MITPDGKSKVIATLGVPGLAIDFMGNVYVSINGPGSSCYIAKVSSSGTVQTIASNLNGLLGIAVDAQDNVYASVNNSGVNPSIIQITPQGIISNYANVTSGVIFAMAVDSGNLYYFYNSSLFEIDSIGNSNILFTLSGSQYPGNQLVKLSSNEI